MGCPRKDVRERGNVVGAFLRHAVEGFRDACDRGGVAFVVVATRVDP